MVIQVCVGSSCHLKGSHDIVILLQDAIGKHHLENEITLVGTLKCTVSPSTKVFTVTSQDAVPAVLSNATEPA